MLNNDKDLGKVVKQRRLTVGLTLRRLGLISGVSQSHLDRVERGERNASARILQKVAKPLGFREGELFTLAGYLHPQSPNMVDGLNSERLDPYVAAVLSQEPFEVQRTAIGILRILNSFTRAVNGVAVNARDVTEHRPTEEVLCEIKEKLQVILDSVTEGIMVTDLTGDITQVNDALVRMHGYDSKQDLMGRSAFKLFTEKDRARAAENLKRASAAERIRDMEYTFLTKDGGECPAELSTAILKDASGNPRGFIAITKEITERKQAEARSLVYRKKLRSLSSQLSLAEERERRRIALQVHDRVSQDLAMCHIRLGALLKTKLSSYCAEQLGEIDGLVRQLIEEVRSLTFEISSPLLYEFGLEAALERFTEQIQAEHGLLCSFEDDGQPKPLDDDIRVLLFQMVRELLVNVIKHAQARKVRVGINKHDNDIRITVEDDGIGFDSRGITSDRKRAKGFGLFSIRERVRYIDGDIQVESERGRGTRVTLVAPLSGSKI